MKEEKEKAMVRSAPDGSDKQSNYRSCMLKFNHEGHIGTIKVQLGVDVPEEISPVSEQPG